MASRGRPARRRVSRLETLARKHDLAVVPADQLDRSVVGVAFDSFTFEPQLLEGGGASLERGTNAAATMLAVGSAPWPQMPLEWVTLRSRHGADHLGAVDEMEPVGHDDFDEAFAVDADDPSTIRRLFRWSLREWLVRYDEQHGPLTIIFDGQSTDLRDQDPHQSTIFVAREVTKDAAFIETLRLTAEFASHVRSALRE